MLVNIITLIFVALTLVVLALPSVTRSISWRAMVTPLASIIGSGFLVLGPILNTAYGEYAPAAMLGLCVGAYLFGSAIRYNIATIEKRRLEDKGQGARSAFVRMLEDGASWSLAFSYIISVSYYLNLFGAFAVSLTAFDSHFISNILTSVVFAVILVVGWFYGFDALEKLEQVSVSIKLSIIIGLLAGLVIYFWEKLGAGALVFNPVASTGWAGITLGFGLIITVQGFETSRYLGEDFDARTRIRTMRYAQLLSSLIYLVYIMLLAYVFAAKDMSLTETAIIDMMGVVAPILPLLLVAAALSAQFSAAVADTSGSGGLIEELTNRRMKTRHAYALLVIAGLVITWSANVFEIISYASRAFALYYAIQSLIAAISAWNNGEKLIRFPLYLALAVLGVAIVVFGTSVE